MTDSRGIPQESVFPDVTAEKAAILAAVSDGSKDFEVSKMRFSRIFIYIST
jgi:hypothetical protein